METEDKISKSQQLYGLVDLLRSTNTFYNKETNTCIQVSILSGEELEKVKSKLFEILDIK